MHLTLKPLVNVQSQTRADADARRPMYLALKGANLALGGLWAFAFTFVLIRTLTLDNYAVAVITGAVGAYVMAVDLGFSGILFSHLRAAFLDGEVERAAPLAVVLFLIYLTLVAAAGAAFWAILEFAHIGHAELRGAFALLLVGFGLALPWAIVRCVMNATDHYIAFEIVELVRRALLVGLPFLIFFGFSFFAFTILMLLAWVCAHAVMLPRALKTLGIGQVASKWNVGGLLMENRTQLGWAAGSSLTEFGVHNFPYVLIPILSSDPKSLIAFDVFYKVTRFAGLAYSAINEAYLPSISRALHAEDARATLRALAGLGGLSTVVALAAGVSMVFFGTPIFRLLLADADLAPTVVRLCIAGFIGALALQCATRFILLYSGQSRTLAHMALTLCAGMALWAAICLAQNARPEAFLIGYAAVYACGALLYGFRLWNAVRAPAGRTNLPVGGKRAGSAGVKRQNPMKIT